MGLAARLDEYGMAAWITVMVLAFIIFWPLGLAILGYLIWSGRMGCWKGGPGRWHNERTRRERAGARGWGLGPRPRSSGNAAFDEYREDTLRRLEQEQQEFQDFLERLRRARDKEEFDQFMAERAKRPGPAAGPEAAGPEAPKA